MKKYILTRNSMSISKKTKVKFNCVVRNIKLPIFMLWGVFHSTILVEIHNLTKQLIAESWYSVIK